MYFIVSYGATMICWHTYREWVRKKGVAVKYTPKIIILIFLFFSNSFYGHGFSDNTLVKLSDGSHATIYSICLYALDHKLSIVSCDIGKLCTINQLVETGKRSKCNCSIRLGFTDQYNQANDITCTPLQEFYVPAISKWLPAYMLTPGDALLTENLTTKTIVYKEFVEKPLKIYMLEVQNTHTFFVGKDSILTHNIFLPVTIGMGFAISFGSFATGTVGSFFGPIGLAMGFAFGGIAGIAFKALYEKRVPRYKTFNCSINIVKNNNLKSSGCFIPECTSESSYIYLRSSDNDLFDKPTGCIEITPLTLDQRTINGCDKQQNVESIYNDGCFQPTEQSEQLPFYSQEKPSIKEKPQPGNKPLSARNWKEFENTPIGQEHGKKFVHTGRYNPKDGSPIRKLTEDISNTEMFKKNHYYALDRFHDGDHFEVWDKKEKWIGVANLDGSKNEKKTNAEKNPNNRNLPK